MASSFLSSGMSFMKKRLVVRLSIVGAILLIGGAVVVWTQYGPQAPGKKTAKKATPLLGGVPAPIQDDEDADDPIRPASAQEDLDGSNGDEGPAYEPEEDGSEDPESPYQSSDQGEDADALDNETSGHRAGVAPGYASKYSVGDSEGGLDDEGAPPEDREDSAEIMQPPAGPGYGAASRYSAGDVAETDSAESDSATDAPAADDTAADDTAADDSATGDSVSGKQPPEGSPGKFNPFSDSEQSPPASQPNDEETDTRVDDESFRGAGPSEAGGQDPESTGTARSSPGGYRLDDPSPEGDDPSAALGAGQRSPADRPIGTNGGGRELTGPGSGRTQPNTADARASGADSETRTDSGSRAGSGNRTGTANRTDVSNSTGAGGASSIRLAPSRSVASRNSVEPSPRLPARSAPDPSLDVSDRTRASALGEGYSPTDDELASGVSSVPGERQLEGPQTPTLSLVKTAPAEVQVGKPVSFEIRVRNLGQVPAHHVTVVDSVPQGAQLQATVPKATVQDGLLTWSLGTMQPGAEHTLQLQVVPQVEGELGSVAQVTFQAQASVRTLATKPDLKVQLSGSKEQVLIGETVQMKITLTNKGTGAATGVVVLCDLPEGLTHPAGRDLERDIGTLRPGETVDIDLLLTAAKPGLATSAISLESEGLTDIRDEWELEVIAPGLEIVAAGPTRRYLERQAVFGIQIVNPGTSPAHNVEVVAYLPKGIQFVEADNQGQYYQQQHAVSWRMSELLPKKPVSVRVTGLPVESGKQKLRVDARADLGLVNQTEHVLDVESHAELLFSVTDVDDPIEENTETTYVIEVKNADTKPDSNIRIDVALPAGLQYVESSGPTEAIEGKSAQQITFQPLPELGAKAAAVYRVKVLGKKEGDHVIQVRVASDRIQRTAVIKEESTHVYRD